MTSAKENYALGWNGHAFNLSNSFKDLLAQKELVDVTFVADGYLFKAHRLVLSALSPYFRQLFNQMPVNREAFVFMKDVSKQTMENLIEFIYSGEVDVDQSGLDELIKTAKTLKIKGITDEMSSFEAQTSESKWFLPACSSFQYQSNRTVQVQNPFNSNFGLSDSRHNQASEEDQKRDEFDIGDAEGILESEYDMDHNYGAVYNHSYGMDNNESSPMDQFSECQSEQWNSNYYNRDNNETRANTVALKVKRAKRTYDTNDFNVIADIRKNASGRDNLFYNGYKFSKNGKGVSRQAWQCSKQSSGRCTVTACTMEIDGVVMMKISKNEHSHQPEPISWSEQS